MGKEEKTNVMRILDRVGAKYAVYTYPADGTLTGVQVAEIIGENPARAFKTLVTQGKSGAYYVFDVPVFAELDLKKGAAAVGEKNVSMIKSKDLLPLTGYIHGGCSPIGMKKAFTTVFDKTAEDYEELCFSGGRLGVFLKVKREDLEKTVKIQYADLTRGDTD